MKLLVTMKDPDVLGDAIASSVAEEISSIKDVDEDEKQILQESRSMAVKDLCSKWFGYGEYLTIEIDTSEKTATVKEWKN